MGNSVVDVSNWDSNLEGPAGAGLYVQRLRDSLKLLRSLSLVLAIRSFSFQLSKLCGFMVSSCLAVFRNV